MTKKERTKLKKEIKEELREEWRQKEIERLRNESILLQEKTISEMRKWLENSKIFNQDDTQLKDTGYCHFYD